MKKSTIILITSVVALTLAFLACRSLGRSFWERTLYGPYSGLPYSGSITSSPVSVLALAPHGQLEVHELSPPTNPVVLLRSPSDTVSWAQILVPEVRYTNGTVHYPGVRDFRLHHMESRSTGSVVYVSCDWDIGGEEGGLISLDLDYGFRSFSLSW